MIAANVWTRCRVHSEAPPTFKSSDITVSWIANNHNLEKAADVNLNCLKGPELCFYTYF